MSPQVGNSSIRDLVRSALSDSVLSSKFLGEVAILVQYRILKASLNGAEPTMENWPHKSHYASWYWEAEYSYRGIIEFSLTEREGMPQAEAKQIAERAYTEADRIAAELIKQHRSEHLIQIINSPQKAVPTKS